MNQEYIEFVKSRAKGGDAILVSLTPEKCHLLHMAVGISGEAAELKAALLTTDAERKYNNVREEFGDLVFYVTGATFAFPHWTPACWQEAMEMSNNKYEGMDAFDSVVLAAGDFLDLVKKYTVYNKPFDELALIQALQNVIVQLRSFGDLEVVANENMTKLLKRYANGYSDKAAQERADKPAGE